MDLDIWTGTRLTDLGWPYVVGIKSSVVVWPSGLELLPPSVCATREETLARPVCTPSSGC